MEAPKPSPDYLMQLMSDRRVAGTAPLNGVFAHVDRLLEQEITRVRADMYGDSLNGGALGRPRVLLLPEPKGSPVQLQEKLFVPVKDYPDFNFVGRILGPRGLTAKQLESETGCRIMVRGRGSMRDKKKEEQNRGKPNWEHLSEELHVLVTVEDSPNRADVKLRHAVEEVKKLLVPSGEGEDNLKKLQLMELAIINGTYRDAAQPRHPSMVPAPPPMAFTMAGPPLSAAHGHRFLAAAAAAAAQQMHLGGPGAQQFHLRGASPGGGQVPSAMGGVPGVPGMASPGMCLPFMRPLHPMLGGPGVPQGVPGVPTDTPGLVYTSYEYPCLLEYPLDHTGVLGAVPTKVRRHDSRVHPYQRDRAASNN